MLQVAIILEDQNENNGCTIIKPKSHLSGSYSNRKEKLFKIKSKAGDLIWDVDGMVQLKIFRKHSLGFNSNIFFLVDQAINGYD